MVNTAVLRYIIYVYELVNPIARLVYRVGKSGKTFINTLVGETFTEWFCYQEKDFFLIFRRLSAGLILLVFITATHLVTAQDATSDSDLFFSSDDSVTSDESGDISSVDVTSDIKKGTGSKQRVVLLDLYDATGNPEYSYLKSLISDSLRLNLSLDEEGIADVVELVQKDEVIKMVIREKLRGKFIWKDQAKKAAREFSADLVSTGYYALDGEKLVITLKAYSAKHDTFTIQITEESLMDYTLIDKIRDLSLKFVRLMQEEYEKTEPESDKPGLIILNYALDGTGADEYNELIELLKEKIETHEVYDIVPGEEVLALLTLLGIAEGTPIPESLSLRIARYFGADIIITGTMEKSVGKVEISTSGINSASGGEVLQTINTITGRDSTETVMEELANYICFGEQIEMQPEEEIIVPEEEEIVEETEEIKKQERLDREKSVVIDRIKKKAGFILTSFGVSSLVFGGSLLAFERLYINNRVLQLSKSPSYADEKELYNQMVTIDTSIFASSLALMGAGAGMLIPGIFLMVKYRDQKIIENKYDALTLALLSSASGFLTAGATMILFDRLSMGPLVRSAKQDSGQYLKYEEYAELYYSDVSLFTLSIGLLSAGAAFLTPAIIRIAGRGNKKFSDKIKVTDMIGYTFLFTGISGLLSGGGMFLFDRTYISYKLQKFRGYARELDEYQEYLRYYNINTPLFISSISLMGLGAVLSIISIPFILGKVSMPKNREKAQIQFEIGYRESLVLAVSCKF